MREELSRAELRHQQLATGIATMSDDISELNGMFKDRDAVISVQMTHVSNLEGLIAQGSYQVDDRYMFWIEKDELVGSLKQSMLDEA